MFGVYIHIPFCAKQCTYCDFHFSTRFAAYRTSMLAALVKEIDMRAPAWKNNQISSIYFGGGTPSLLHPDELHRLLSAVQRVSDSLPDVEITLECNPEDCTDAQLEQWKSAGINRLSIGIQSFNDVQLQWMNRTHDGKMAKEAVLRAIHWGFDVLTADLIYGLPQMDLKELKLQVDTLVSLGVNHISAYCLTVERKTALDALVKRGEIVPSNVDEQSEQFLYLVDYLASLGYEQYEISNFARNEAYARHNSNYWKGIPYMGIGPSAHGFQGNERYWNVANNHAYMRSIAQGELPEEKELLSPYDLFNETLLIGLRTKWGVDKKSLFAFLSPNELWFSHLKKFKEAELITESETSYCLTKMGKLRADGIASDLFILPNE